MIKCSHIKIYSNKVLQSIPPQFPWICSVCLEEGTDRGLISESPSYNDLMNEKAKLQKNDKKI